MNPKSQVIEFTRAPVALRVQMETIVITTEQVSTWIAPPFQRPLHVNDKVREVATFIAAEEIVPGVLTVGVIDRGTDRGTYLVDGQHRIEAFKISGLSEALATVKVMKFNSFADMGQEFVELNSSLARMRPDDILRGLEGRSEPMTIIRTNCPFVGYDQIRRNTQSPVISMSSTLRCWHNSSKDAPGGSGQSALHLAHDTTAESAKQLCGFLHLAMDAWGRDVEHNRLWANLNLTLSMWMYRRLVLDGQRGTKRYVVLNHSEFKKCLMSLAADKDYSDWLLGRTSGERDRSPCYSRLRRLFASRLAEERRGASIKLPAPSWSTT